MNVDKKQLLKESFIATLIIVLITSVIIKIPFSLEYGKAIRQGFADFDIYDLHYSGVTSPARDTNVIIVEIGIDRSEIADQIELISSYDPKVIGIDATFENQKDSANDYKFLSTINKYHNIIYGKRFTDESGFRVMPNFFETKENQYGLINFIGNQFSVLRYFAPYVHFKNEKHPAFAVAISKLYNETVFQKLNKRNNEREIINYAGNIERYTSFSVEELLAAHMSGQLSSVLKNKIVLLGFFMRPNPADNIHPILNDLHYSPLNERVSGKSHPDIYGVVVHANIISMILNQDYATQAPEIITYLFAFLLTWIFYYYLLGQYNKTSHPSHGKFLLIQFAGIIIILYIFLLIFNWSLFKIQLEPILVCLVLCVEMMGLYKLLAVWLHKKYKYKSVFT